MAISPPWTQKEPSAAPDEYSSDLTEWPREGEGDEDPDDGDGGAGPVRAERARHSDNGLRHDRDRDELEPMQEADAHRV